MISWTHLNSLSLSLSVSLSLSLSRQGKWKASDTRRKAQDKLKIFSHASDLTQTSDQPSFPYTLRDLVSWLWGQVMSTDYIFRRQCMACLGELCPLLPLPESRIKPPSSHTSTTTTSSSSKKSRRPKHLQAICDYIYALREFQNISHTLTSGSGPTSDLSTTPVDLISHNLTLQLSTTYRQFYSHFSQHNTDGNTSDRTYGSNLENQELEIRWLEALNGSLDSYNWLIKCLEATPASSLFLLSTSSHGQEDEFDKKGMKRKRQQSDNTTPHTHELLPLGEILMTNILFFTRLCCIRLLNLQYEGPQLYSYAQSHLLGRSTQQQYHEKLILEVYRRILQLFSVLLETDILYFLTYFQNYGLCLKENHTSGHHELTPEIQFLLLCGLGVLDMTEIKNNYENNLLQRNIMQTIETIADHVIQEIKLPNKNFIYHFSHLPHLLSFSVILNEKKSEKYDDSSSTYPLDGRYRGVGNDFQSEEYVTNIPIAIEQLLLYLSKANYCHLLSSPLWSNILTYTLQSLTPTSFLSSVLAVKRCVTILKRCGVLNIPFGTNFHTVLKTIGLSLIQATLRSSEKRLSTAGQSGRSADGVHSNQIFSLTPTAIEVGSVLLSLSVEFEVPIASSFSSLTLSSSTPTTLIDLILALPHSSSQTLISPNTHTNTYTGELFLQYYGSTIVDLLIGLEGEEIKFLDNCKLFLQLISTKSKQSLSSSSSSETDVENIVLTRCSLLLSKICTGIVERAHTMRSDILAQFIFLYAEQIDQESLYYSDFPATSHLKSSRSTFQPTMKLFCTRENISLILHLESLLPQNLREESVVGGTSVSPLVMMMKKIRHFLGKNIFQVFNSCGDTSVKDITTSPLFEGDLCDCIVKSFQLLPYLVPGTTAICPRLCSATTMNSDEEKRLQSDVSPSVFDFLIIFACRSPQH
jgi:hypothetical protein